MSYEAWSAGDPPMPMCEHTSRRPYEPERSVGDESDYQSECRDCGAILRDPPTRTRETGAKYRMMRFHPMQTIIVPTSVIAPLALRAYEVYCHIYGEQPAMIDTVRGCRGGFSVGELLAFLYARSFPKAQWCERFEEALEREPLKAKG